MGRTACGWSVACLAVLLGSCAVAAPRAKSPTRSSASKRKTSPAAPPKPTLPAPPAAVEEALPKKLVVFPPEIKLHGRRARQLLLVQGVYEKGEVRDLSRSVKYAIEGRVAAVDEAGQVAAVADGEAKVRVTFGKRSASVDVAVSGVDPAAPPSFLQDVVPLLTQAGCNSLSCHGSPVGKNGFKLSMYGSDPALDHAAIVKTERTTPEKGVRVDLTQPEQSLVLQKASMQQPHLGGLRFKKGSESYALLLEWLRAGAPLDPVDPLPAVAALEFTPAERVITALKQPERMLVTARYTDGTTEDVTHKAIYSTNDESVAVVDSENQIAATGVGETVVLARYLGFVGTTGVLSPQPGGDPKSDYKGFEPAGFVDELALAKWKRAGFAPSTPTTDAEFIRRVSLDLIGTLPTPEELAAFLADDSRDKRSKLIDELLKRPEYADWWSVFWGDLLRNNSRLLQDGAKVYRSWIRESLAANKPYDQFVRELITATGDTFTDGPPNFYRVARTAAEQAEQAAQLFLGVRVQCANCHNHPAEKITRTNYHQFAAFFAQVQTRGNGRNGTAVSNNPGGAYRHPETNRPLDPAVLADNAPPVPGDRERREALADWLCSKDNIAFARNLVNRLWGQMFGRGIVDPVDDMRVTNPAVNEPLLDALAKDFITGGFDVQRTLRVIANSRTYQLSSRATPRNEKDRQSFSRAYLRRLKAEVLLDAICQVTNQPESFNGHPPGTRAIQLTDNRVASYFMDTFGRPRREIVCTCEREEVANITQALHLINGETLHRKITSPQGRLLTALKTGQDDGRIVDELYQWTFSRLPTDAEREEAVRRLGEATTQGAPARQAAWEDQLWVLLNSGEFLFNH